MSIKELAIADREMLMESRITPEARASIAASAALMAWEIYSPICRARRYVVGLYNKFSAFCGFSQTDARKLDPFLVMYYRAFKER